MIAFALGETVGETLAQEWDELHQRCLDNHPYSNSAWLLSYIEQFGSDEKREIVIATGRDQTGALQVAAAFEIGFEAHWGVHYRVLRFLGTENYLFDYAEILAEDKQSAAQLLQHVLRSKQFDVLEIRNVLEGSLTASALQAIAPTDAEMSSPYTAPGIQFDSDGQVLGDLLKKKSLRRHRKYFERQGALLLRSVEDEAELSEALPKFFQQHIERWHSIGNPSQFLDATQSAFFSTLGRRLLNAKSLRFDILECDGNAIAYHFGFQHGDRFYWYKPSFDPLLAKHSPGEALLHALFEKYAAHVSYFDFTIGNEAFKNRFANSYPRILWWRLERPLLLRLRTRILATLRAMRKVVRNLKE
jgi:CelD/BcsL family acetyltransferase involved in cellulose biosynthesis